MDEIGIVNEDDLPDGCFVVLGENSSEILQRKDLCVL